MAIFLVDYENVSGSDGLKGVEYLCESDKIIIFYSKACPSIRRDELGAILDSGCDFKICKLIRCGKNGLDFYIAAEAGALADNGETQIAVISKDKGYTALIDYLRSKHESENLSIIKAANIERAIVALNSPSDMERRIELLNQMKMLDIGQEYAKYEEKKTIKAQIKHVLLGTKYEAMSNNVIDFIDVNKHLGKKGIYTRTLHAFGKNAGTEIYRLIKEVV